MPSWFRSIYSDAATGNVWTTPTSSAITTTSGLYTNTLFNIFGGNSATSSATNPIWASNTNTWTWTTVDPQTLWEQQARAYERYAFPVADLDGVGQLFTPLAPAIITPRELERRDREAYARALTEHNEQEAARLQRAIMEHERLSAEQRHQAEQRAQLAREEQGRRIAATGRARELLLEHLNPAQRDTFTRNGWFIVEGGKSKTKYRIGTRGVAGNIDVMDKAGRTTHRLCCHAIDGGIPAGDQWLAQKIMLELAEDDFLRKANRHAA